MSPVQGHGIGGGKSKKEMLAEQQAHIDQTPIITRCAFCTWTHEGTALEGREHAQKHRRKHHPEAKPTTRRRVGLMRHVSTDDEHRAEGLAKAAKVAASLARLEETA
jgi:hypothetical protein